MTNQNRQVWISKPWTRPVFWQLFIHPTILYQSRHAFLRLDLCSRLILDSQLNLRRPCDDVILKGTKKANFLSSLSNTKWGLPTRLSKILITSMLHATTDYAVTAWLRLPIPELFSEKLTLIDNICKIKALGALRKSLSIFLGHNLDMTPLEVRLSAKNSNTVAIIAAKHPSTPLYHLYCNSAKQSPTRIKVPSTPTFSPP